MSAAAAPDDAEWGAPWLGWEDHGETAGGITLAIKQPPLVYGPGLPVPRRPLWRGFLRRLARALDAAAATGVE